MHVLARGDLLQRLRLASGLVLLTFAATHFLNHALGLVSLDAMQEMQAWRKLVTRSWLGSGVLLAAFLTHISLALYKISRRLTWKLPFWEAAQILTGLSIPLFLITHVVYNRGAASLAGTDDTYAFELGNIWPGLAWEHSLLLLMVWVHGCIGLHYWLSLAGWYRRVQPVLLALAVALPVSALAGFSVAGRQVAARIAEPGAWEQAADGLPCARCRSRRPAGDAARRPAHGIPGAPRPRVAGARGPQLAARRRRQGRGDLPRRADGARALGPDAARDQPHERRAACLRLRRPRPLLDLPRRRRDRARRADAAGRRRGHDARQHQGAAARAARLPDPAARAHHGHAPGRRRHAQGRLGRQRRASSARWRCCSSTRAASP